MLDSCRRLPATRFELRDPPLEVVSPRPDPLGPEVDHVAANLAAVGPNADASAHLEYPDIDPAVVESTGGGQAGQPPADDGDVSDPLGLPHRVLAADVDARVRCRRRHRPWRGGPDRLSE